MLSRRTLVISLPILASSFPRMRVIASLTGSIDDSHVKGIGMHETCRDRLRLPHGRARR